MTYSWRRNFSTLPAKVTWLPRDIILNPKDLEMFSFSLKRANCRDLSHKWVSNVKGQYCNIYRGQKLVPNLKAFFGQFLWIKHRIAKNLNFYLKKHSLWDPTMWLIPKTRHCYYFGSLSCVNILLNSMQILLSTIFSALWNLQYFNLNVKLL